MYSKQDTIQGFDPELWSALEQETRRQEDHIELIASENYASPRVLAAQGSVLTSYAEGLPAAITAVASMSTSPSSSRSIRQAVFNAGDANVQPQPGSQANFAVYTAVLRPGDTILAWLGAGGHLTHGVSNLSGRISCDYLRARSGAEARLRSGRALAREQRRR